MHRVAFNGAMTVVLFLSSWRLGFCQSSWEWRNPPLYFDNLRSVTYYNNHFVATGPESHSIISPDGVNWSIVSSDSAMYHSPVCYGDTLFVTVGSAGTILVSSDGKIWTRKTSGTDADLNAVVYGNNRFVSVGDSGVILNSSDGSNWTKSTIPDTNLFFNSVAYGNGRYVAVCEGWDKSIWTSSDGINWAVAITDTWAFLRSIVYGGGQFVAVGTAVNGCMILTSPDGETWTSRTSDSSYGQLLSVSFGNGKFVAAGGSGLGGVVVTSPDGIAWTENPVTSQWLYGVTYGGDRFVAVGANGTVISSEDGNTWTSWKTTNKLAAVAYGNGRFVAVGEFGTIIAFSGDSIGDPEQSGTVNPLRSVIFGNGRFIAVGFTGTILSSSDGSHWSKESSGTAYNLQAVTYGNGQYVAVGDSGTIVTSTDGETWSLETSGTTSGLKAVTYGDNLYVAVAFDHSILTSTDGMAWMIPGGSSCSLNSVAFGNGRFVAVGTCFPPNNREPSHLWVLSSVDGTDWTGKVEGMYTYQPYSVTYANGRFFILMQDGRFLASSDGTDWTANSFAVDYRNIGPNAMAYGGNRFVAVGFAGMIISSKADSNRIGVPRVNIIAANKIKINIINRNISVALASDKVRGRVTVELYTVSGKRIYASPARITKGIITIPAAGLAKCVYILSIARGGNRIFLSAIALTR